MIARNGSVELYYEVAGDGELVAFVEDLGFGAWMWGWQHAAVAGPYETIVWDNRGTGCSDAPAGPYTVEEMAADLEAVLADHGARRAHVVGAGLGGTIAIEYALTYGRARSLTLIGTSPGGAHASIDGDALDRAFAPAGDRAALRSSTEWLLGADVRGEHPDLVDGIVEWRASGDAGEAGWSAQRSALEGFDASDRLYEVDVPTLVVHGRSDPIYSVENARLLADGIPKADLELFDGGHLVFVERSRPVNDALLAFFEGLTDR